MGSASSTKIVYAQEFEIASTEDETGIYRSNPSPSSLSDAATESSLKNTWDIFQHGKLIDPNNSCLGWREKLANDYFGDYKWFSYQAVEKMALALGTALMDIVSVRYFPDEVYPRTRQMRLLGIYSKNCVPWFVCEQAANAYNLTLVPFYDTLKESATAYIFKETQLSVAAGSVQALVMFLKIPEVAAQLEIFISFEDTIPQELLDEARASQVELKYYSELLKTTPKPCNPGDLMSVNTLNYTSGTTGNPKSVIITNGNVVATVAAVLKGPLDPTNQNFHVSHRDSYLSYLPAAHVFERAFVNILYYNGAKVGCFSGDTLKLLNDVQALKPTIFVSVPRLFNRIHDKIFGGIQEKSALAQKFFAAGISTKIKQFKSENNLSHKFFDSLVFNKVKSAMGGELRYMIVGGAPLSPLVQEKVTVMFSVPLIQGYGMTESFGTSFIGSTQDQNTGHVGGPVPSIEFKLRSVPSLNYFVKGDIPQGEILMRGPSVTPGYFRHPEETAAMFDKDGWLCTGDVAELLPNRALRIIDRKKNIFKLSQGEYVCPEIIESLYVQSQYVSQVFVYGRSEENSLVSIIVIDQDIANKYIQKNHLRNTTPKDLCRDPEFIKLIEADLNRIGKGVLKGFEKVKAFHLTTEAFQEDNGLITPTHKLKRKQIKQRYEAILDELYTQTQ